MPDAYDFWAARLDRDSMDRVAALWRRFAKAEPALRAALDQPPPDRVEDPDALLHDVLGPLADTLDHELAPGGPDGAAHTLVLSAGPRHDRRPLARALVAHAPSLPGWAFTDIRAAVADPADAPQRIALRDPCRRLLLKTLDAAPGDHCRIDAIPDGAGDAEALARQARLAFTTLLGEDVCRDWVGRHQPRRRRLFARLAGPARDPAWCLPFRDACRELISATQDILPERPFWQSPYDRTGQVMYRTTVPRAEPDWRHDTITGYTSYRPMTQARMAGDPLASARFSRFGESFCGLKVARTPEFHFDETEQRVALAEGAHLMLSARRQGGVTGEAHGRAHIYIDLALADLEGSVATLSELLERIELTSPAWLIFDEAGLTGRSVPLTPMTPAEPREEYG